MWIIARLAGRAVAADPDDCIWECAVLATGFLTDCQKSNG